jgi:hypothetical protein
MLSLAASRSAQAALHANKVYLTSLSTGIGITFMEGCPDGFRPHSDAQSSSVARTCLPAARRTTTGWSRVSGGRLKRTSPFSAAVRELGIAEALRTWIRAG